MLRPATITTTVVNPTAMSEAANAGGLAGAVTAPVAGCGATPSSWEDDEQSGGERGTDDNRLRRQERDHTAATRPRMSLTITARVAAGPSQHRERINES